MRKFDYAEPQSLAEASQVLADNAERAKVLAGGAALIILMRNRLISPELVVNIKRIPNLNQIAYDPRDGLRIGALATHRDVEFSPVVKQRCPALAELEEDVASIQVRNRATLAGNLCHAEPASDPPTLLLAMGACVKLVGPSGARVVPLDDFILGYYDTALQPGEILAEVQVPPAPPGTGAFYAKYSTRTAMDMCLLGAAAVVTLDGGAIKDVKVAAGNVHNKPVRCLAVEERLRGQAPDAKLLREASALAAEGIDPVSDVRGSAEYRREMVKVMCARALQRAVANVQAA